MNWRDPPPVFGSPASMVSKMSARTSPSQTLLKVNGLRFVVSCENPRRMRFGLPPPGANVEPPGALYPGTCRALSKVKYAPLASVPKPTVLTRLDCVLTHVVVHCWKFQPLFSTNVSTKEKPGMDTALLSSSITALWKNWPDRVNVEANSPALPSVSVCGSHQKS